MVSKRLSAMLAIGIAFAEQCQESERTSMMQTRPMRDELLVSKKGKRHLQVWHDKASDAMCLPALAGDRAPMVGVFKARGSNDAQHVEVGQVASTPGQFCVDSKVFSLLQRSLGLNDGAVVEAALTKKNGGGDDVDSTTGQKNSVDGSTGAKSGPTAVSGYSQLAARCKPDGSIIGEEEYGLSLEQCKERCESSSQCKAFEFEFEAGECELLSAVNATASRAHAHGVGTCNANTCCYQKSGPAAPHGYFQVAARCKPDGFGIGAEETGLSLEQCKGRCESESQCNAFEFEPETGECELVSAVNATASLADEDGACSADSCCYQKFVPPAPSGYSQVAARCKPDGFGIGAEEIGLSLEQCKDRCESEGQCNAFEFEPETGECELVSAVNVTASLADEDGACSAESCCYQKQ